MSRLCQSAPLLVVLGACGAAGPRPAAFVDGTCRAPGEVFVLAEDEDQVHDIAVHGEHVYWTSARGPRRLHRNGGPVEDLAIPDRSRAEALPNGSPAFGLYVDDSYVYFGAGQLSVGAGVWRVPPSGGDPQLAAVLEGGGPAREIVGDARSVFAVDVEFGRLYRVEKRDMPGARVLDLAGGERDAYGLAMDDVRVWWGNRSVEKDGFGLRLAAAHGANSIALAGDTVFYGSDTGRIIRLRQDGTVLAALTSDRVADVTAHGDRIFWAHPGPAGGFGSARVDGSDLAVTPLDDAPNTQLIAVADDAVYLVSHPTAHERIVKVCR